MKRNWRRSSRSSILMAASILRGFSPERLKGPTPFGLGLKSEISVQQGATLRKAFRVTNQVPGAIMNYGRNSQKP